MSTLLSRVFKRPKTIVACSVIIIFAIFLWAGLDVDNRDTNHFASLSSNGYWNCTVSSAIKGLNLQNDNEKGEYYTATSDGKYEPSACNRFIESKFGTLQERGEAYTARAQFYVDAGECQNAI